MAEIASTTARLRNALVAVTSPFLPVYFLYTRFPSLSLISVESAVIARELLSKQDEFLTVTVGDREYSISHTKSVKTHANIDDGVLHKTLVCNEDKLGGNIVR